MSIWWRYAAICWVHRVEGGVFKSWSFLKGKYKIIFPCNSCKWSNIVSVYSVAGLSRCAHLTLLRAHATTASLHQGIPGSLWKLGRLNHVAIAVPDMEKATALYRDVLGATVSDKVPLPEHGVYTVFVELGNTKLELLHPLGEKSPIAGFLQKNKSGGMHHICIEVRSILLIRGHVFRYTFSVCCRTHFYTAWTELIIDKV